MSQSILVRCRDGALYRDPLWIFPEGFICLDAEDPPEIVLWLRPDNVEGPPNVDLIGVLGRVFGYGHFVEKSGNVDSVGYIGRSERVIPGSDPFVFRPAISYRFKVEHRPPRPTTNEGVARHARGGGGTVFDWPALPDLDARFLEMPTE